jgi:hypothetical protein
MGIANLLGVCEDEALAIYECWAAGGIRCEGTDTNGDGTEDVFQPVRQDECPSVTPEYSNCELGAPCKRFCNEATATGCGGDGCVETCEQIKASYGSCGTIYYGAYVNCGASTHSVTCGEEGPRPSQCVKFLFDLGDCVDSSAPNECSAYCFASEYVGCATDCATECAARIDDPTCGAAWASLLQCTVQDYDVDCEEGLLLPSPTGSCSTQRAQYEACTGG